MHNGMPRKRVRRRAMRDIRDLEKMTGGTPLVEISFRYKGEERKIFAKVEYYNLSGSVKDRMAYYVIKKAYERGEIAPGDTIVEATSGNTGISFCAIGAYLGHPVVIYMPDWMSEERKRLIASYGAEIRGVSKEQGGFLGSIALAEKYAKENEGVFYPRQFENEDNATGQYKSLGAELVKDLKYAGLSPDAFVAGVGTGGTVMGVARALKEEYPSVKVRPLEPLESPTLSTGVKVGSHRIAGISDEFIPPICKLDELDEVVNVSDGDAIIMAQKLGKMGLGVGISSGANFIGAVKALEDLDKNDETSVKDRTVVTVFTDDNKKYLTTDLLKEEPVKPGYLSTDIELLGMRVVNDRSL